MAPREGPAERGRRRARELLVDIGREARSARLGAGLSQDSVGAAAAISRSSVSRLERGRAPRVSFERVTTHLAVVGLDLGARAYPGGPPIRDAAHVRLLARFRARVGSTWRWRPEVPIGGTGDQRAWDGVLVGNGRVVAIEAETRLHDVQALLRRMAAKRRDGAADRLVLVVADTRTNRDVVRIARGEFLAVFPADARSTWSALGDGLPPTDDGMVLV
jgi:transcriptional regulator with XRE-family HTH domain